VKKKIINVIAIISLLSTTVLAGEKLPEAGPNALSIVLDTAWSNEPEMSDYQSLVRQGMAILKPGDYLEIITGHPGKPQLRVAQFIKTGDAQELKSIATPMNNVKCPILSDVNVSKAVDMALKRLIKSDTKNSFDHATVIVFSDGKLNDADVNKLRQLSKECKKRNWSLCVTGTYQTNRKLLVAANQGDLKFSLISEANPVLWIQRSNVVSKPALLQASVPVNPQPGDKAGKANSTTSIDVEISVSQGEEQPAETPPVTVPEEIEQEPVKTEEAAQTEELVPAEIGDKPTEETPVIEDTTPPDTTKKSSTTLNMLMWLLPLILVVGIMAAILLSSLSKARKWKSKTTSRLKDTEKRNQGTLIAKLNGRTYNLGRLDYINKIHIGSGPKNTIRISDKSINDRLIAIYRKGNGLILKNIGTSAVAVNGIQTKPKAKQKLILPSAIKFNDRVMLNLELMKSKIANPNTRSNEDGNN